MIIRLFRSQYLVQYVLLLIFTALLWGDALFFPEKLVTGQGFEGFPGIQSFVLSFPHISVIVSILLLYFQAILLNSVLNVHRLGERNQLTAAAIYVLIMSNQPIMVQPNVMLLVNFLLILLLYMILKLYGDKEPLGDLFDVGLLVGLASLLYFPAITFIIFIVVSLVIFQLYRGREWLIPIIGFITPYIFVATWFFWLGQLSEKFQAFIARFSFQVPDYPAVPIESILIWGLFMFLVFVGMGSVLKLATGGSVDGRRKSRIIISMFLVSILSAFISGQSLISHVYLEIIPVVVFLATYISKLKKLFLIELVFTIIFIAIVAIKVLNFS